MSQSRDVQRAQLLSHSASGLLRGQVAGLPHQRFSTPLPTDPASGTDLVLAQIFVTMRGTLGCSREKIASRLGTATATIELLEAGQVSALPPWSETLRVIETYGLVVGIDVGPVLDRLQKAAALPPPDQSAALSSFQRTHTPVPAPAAPDLQPPAWHPTSLQPAIAPAPPKRSAARKLAATQPRAAPRAPSTTQSAPQPAAAASAPRSAPSVPRASPAPAARAAVAQSSGDESGPPPANDRVAAIAARLNQAADVQARSGLSRRRRATVAAASIAVTIGTVGALLTALPSSTTSANPDGSFASTMRMSIERIVDGLRWIDVSDPKTRKSDKLHPAK